MPVVTVTKALEKLPEPFKTQILTYHYEHGYDKHTSYNTVDNVKSALVKGFNWHKTKEGWAHWYKLFNYLKYKQCQC